MCRVARGLEVEIEIFRLQGSLVRIEIPQDCLGPEEIALVCPGIGPVDLDLHATRIEMRVLSLEKGIEGADQELAARQCPIAVHCPATIRVPPVKRVLVELSVPADRFAAENIGVVITIGIGFAIDKAVALGSMREAVVADFYWNCDACCGSRAREHCGADWGARCKEGHVTF